MMNDMDTVLALIVIALLIVALIGDDLHAPSPTEPVDRDRQRVQADLRAMVDRPGRVAPHRSGAGRPTDWEPRA